MEITAYAMKTQLAFEPLPASLALDATGDQYTTPETHRETTADLSQFKYVRGSVAWALNLSGASATGSADIELKNGTNVVGSETVDLSSGTNLRGAFDVDLTSVNGAAKLALNVSVTTAADASTTADFAGKLTIEHPLVVRG